MVPWGFVGSTRLQNARRLLPEAWLSWCKEWCFNAVNHTQDIIHVSEAGAEQIKHAEWVCAELSDGKIWVGYGSNLDWHGQVFAGIKELPNDAVAVALIEQAKLALVNSVLAAIGMEKVTTVVQAVPSQSLYASSRVVMQIAESVITLVIDASLLNQFLPVSQPQKVLNRRDDVIGSTRVSLRVYLPLERVSVAALDQLQPGDVLPTAAPLSQRFQLVLPDGPQASGYLVRHNSQRVLQLADH